jgi:hypothetical protein
MEVEVKTFYKLATLDYIMPYLASDIRYDSMTYHRTGNSH